ncbi:MAG: GH116 family glycosyl hydrolase [Verrucomicrobiae bacterium]
MKTTMHRSQLPRSGMALGGIGTGGFEIRQDGGTANWSLFNNWPQFPGARFPHNAKQALFFMLWVKPENENQRLVLLQIEDSHGSAGIEGHEFQYMFPWISGVDTICTAASFPFCDLDFEQDGLPLQVSLRAWSPFIPGNVKDSSLPLAYFDFDIRSTCGRPIDVQVLAICRNVAAYDQPERIYDNRRVRDGGFSAVVLSAGQTDPAAATTGSLCLASLDEKSTAYMGWEHHHPYYERLLRECPMPEVDDTDGRNSTDAKTGKRKADPRCFATIGRAANLPVRGDGFQHTFALAWHFPNLYGRIAKQSDSSGSHDEPNGHDRLEGHYYSNFFGSSEEVARYAGCERVRLLEETSAFHRTFFDSSLPGFVLDQVNSQLNTFRTSTWLTKTRMFGVLEGLSPKKPWAGIATTDVAMYGQIAASLLFPELDRMTVDAWRKFQNPNGSVVHSVSCNSYEANACELTGHRLDMPAQFVFMTLRAALWSGDRRYLESVWPNVKSALAYVLRERDKNGDHLPDMDGIMCSYDNFPMFGVAPYVATQWLAAVALALHAARLLGDTLFSGEYAAYFQQGCSTLEKTTWNGRYFALYSDEQAANPAEKTGCMTDQILGEGVARQLGLPHLVDPEKSAAALRAILAMNYKPDQGLRNCQWPGDTFLHEIGKDTWVDQANTCWTGVEFSFAAHLYAAGLHENAEEIIRNVDARHRKWGMYWDHQEFGGHYFRPMSALAIPNAFLGLSYDGETLRIAPARPLPPGRWCVLLPGACGTFFQDARGCRLEIRSGSVKVKTIELPASGTATFTGSGEILDAEANGSTTTIRMKSAIAFEAGCLVAISGTSHHEP